MNELVQIIENDVHKKQFKEASEKYDDYNAFLDKLFPSGLFTVEMRIKDIENFVTEIEEHFGQEFIETNKHALTTHIPSPTLIGRTVILSANEQQASLLKVKYG